jgi:methionyl-tRNA formyltransferase (EC 2.1.2.9)
MEKPRIVFMGTPDFAVPILTKLIEAGYPVVGCVTQPDRPVGRKQVMTPPPVKRKAMEYGIQVLQPEKIREEKSLEEVFRLQPELIITAAFGQILPEKLLRFPKFGCINIHASLLPELRGGAPIHHAILRGMKETGITLMYMEKRLDAGDIISQRAIPIEERDTVGTLHDKLSLLGAELLIEKLPRLLTGEITPVRQDDSKATYANNITRNDEKIDWEAPGEAVYNRIRGLNPWPVAYTTLNGEILKIWWGEKVLRDTDKRPGTIIAVEPDGFLVATGDRTAIKVTELQPAGKRPMTAAAFLRGIKPESLLGKVLGG